jgi:hypothetical protein
MAAPFTDNFDALIAELNNRAAVLTNSTDKLEMKQGKVCVKVLKTLAKDSQSIVTDLKTAGKVAKTLQKAFPAEFGTNTVAGAAAAMPVESTSLGELIAQLFAEFETEIGSALTTLQELVAGFPAGSLKDQATALIEQGLALLAEAEASGDYSQIAKLLADAIDDILRQLELYLGTLANGDNTMTATIGGAAFEGICAGVNDTASGRLGLGGVAPDLSGLVTLVTSNATGIGTYPLAEGTMFQDLTTGITYADNVTGTVTFVAIDLAAGTAAGVFEFTAAEYLGDGSNTVTVTAGEFTTSLIVTGSLP